MASAPLIELPLTLRLSPQAREELTKRAEATGVDLASYVSNIVERNAQAATSLDEISGPIYEHFLQSGLTDEQLGDLLEKEKHEARAHRRARHAS